MSNVTPMDPATLEALKGSIAKWEAIVAGTGDDNGPQNCPLCQMFNPHMKNSRNGIESKCAGCPIAESTGKHFCDGTPYAFFSDEDDDGNIPNADTEGWTQHAQAELDFLRSLLPVTPATKPNEGVEK